MFLDISNICIYRVYSGLRRLYVTAKVYRHRGWRCSLQEGRRGRMVCLARCGAANRLPCVERQVG